MYSIYVYISTRTRQKDLRNGERCIILVRKLAASRNRPLTARATGKDGMAIGFKVLGLPIVSGGQQNCYPNEVGNVQGTRGRGKDWTR